MVVAVTRIGWAELGHQATTVVELQLYGIREKMLARKTEMEGEERHALLDFDLMVKKIECVGLLEQ
jgi:hypothetical protein